MVHSAQPIGIPTSTSATKYGIMNAPPPFAAAVPGKRRKLPSPTAEPATARMTPSLLPHCSRFASLTCARSGHRTEAVLILQHDGAAVEIEQTLLLELRQRERDGLARGPDQVRHLLMRDLEPDLHAVLALDAVLLAELEQERRELGLHVAEHEVLELGLHLTTTLAERAREVERELCVGQEQLVEALA